MDSLYIFYGTFQNTQNISGRDTMVNSLAIDTKIAIGYFFSKHFGTEFSFQLGLSNIYKNTVVSVPNYNGGYVADIKAGRFYTYSLGIVYRLNKINLKPIS